MRLIRVLLNLAIALFHTFQFMQGPTAAPIGEAPWQQCRLTHGKLFFLFLQPRAQVIIGWLGFSCLKKQSTREVDLLMRKNKTGLTAHHFMSGPGDSLSYSFPLYFVCLVAKTPSKCISWSVPTWFFSPPFSTLWPVTDTSVQSINLNLP